jgi:hypothetical protein
LYSGVPRSWHALRSAEASRVALEPGGVGVEDLRVDRTDVVLVEIEVDVLDGGVRMKSRGNGRAVVALAAALPAVAAAPAPPAPMPDSAAAGRLPTPEPEEAPGAGAAVAGIVAGCFAHPLTTRNISAAGTSRTPLIA